jgi:hypothetical protein
MMDCLFFELFEKFLLAFFLQALPDIYNHFGESILQHELFIYESEPLFDLVCELVLSWLDFDIWI